MGAIQIIANRQILAKALSPLHAYPFLERNGNEFIRTLC